MYKYEFTMVNGEKFETVAVNDIKEFKSLVKLFSIDDMYMETMSGESIRCKYIVSIREIK